MTSNKLNIIVLAAGKGTRMVSDTPKVLHKLAGKSLLAHVIDMAKSLKPSKIIVVYGFGGDAVPNAFADEQIIFTEQKEQLGTGHAVMQALNLLDTDAKSLILLGDVPLVNAKACAELLQLPEQLSLLSLDKHDPTGYGRIVRNTKNQVTAIIEHKDANEQQRQINEVNTGIMAVDNAQLKNWLSRISNQNAQKEYYLTDIIALAVADGLSVSAIKSDNEPDVTGVNSKQDLSGLERIYQLRYATSLMQKGVTLHDPARIDVRGVLTVGRDVEIDVNCIFEGNVILGDNVKIAANCVIKNANIKAGVQIAAFTHIDDAEVGDNSRIGPYARLRPGTVLQSETHIGNFVELKNAQVDIGSKINHLSYVGDATIGKNVNVGAGVITCNYDGANKFRTVIEDGAFIGSDSQLVAPVTIGANATIAAGSTITKNAPADALTFCRAKEQKTIVGWKRPQKIKKPD